MRHTLVRRLLAATLAASAATLACTSTETSSSVAAPSNQKCQFQIGNSPSSFPEGGGQGSLTIGTSRDCGWSVSTSVAWVTVGNTSGQGDATISYLVASNSVASTRAAAIVAAGQTVQLTQSAATCRFSLARTSDSLPADGGNFSVNVHTAEGCGWTAFSSIGWLRIVSGLSGNTSGPIGYSVTANTGASRVGYLNIAGLLYTVTQDGKKK
jgi:hypothetical protein